MKSIQRREFLKTAAVTASAVGLAGRSWAAPVDTDPTGMVPLGQALKVSRLGFGTGMRGWNQESNQTRMGPDKFTELTLYAYDQGVRFYDMADIYGSHSFFAKALAGKPRDSYAYCSKIWWRPGGIPYENRPDADVVVERFLKECKTDYLDLVQLHCCTEEDWPTKLAKQMDILERLKEKGIVRAHGVSCHSLDALRAAAETPWVDVVHARINPFGVKMDGPPEEVVPVLKKIHAAGKGVIGMKIIGEGEFAGDPEKRRESAEFAVGLGCVDVLIVGFEEKSHVDELKKNVALALRKI